MKKKNKPQDVMPDVKSVIILELAYQKELLILPQRAGRVHKYLDGSNCTLRIIAFQLAKIIEKEGYRATIVPMEGREFEYWYADRETLKGNLSIKICCILRRPG